MVKLLMNIVLNRPSPFYESQLLTTKLGFCSDKGYNDGTPSNSIRKLHPTSIENYVPAFFTLQQHITPSIETSAFYPLEIVFSRSLHIQRYMNGPIMVKVRINILLTRLSPFDERQLQTTQFRFHSSKRCSDDICHQTATENPINIK